MQHYRNGGAPWWLPDPATHEYKAQRIVLLELVVDPPRDGDCLGELTRLGLPAAHVERAITALTLTGLAQRHHEVVRATDAAIHFEHLWPVLR